MPKFYNLPLFVASNQLIVKYPGGLKKKINSSKFKKLTALLNIKKNAINLKRL